VDVRVAGVDGCRGGWLVVTAVASPFVVVGCEVAAGIAVVLERGDLAMVAVDMPIGLPFDESARMADVEARRRLGPRRSSVFPTPARAVLHARSFEDALVRSRATTGRGLSIQAWNLVPKIAALDAAMTVGLQARVRETHPELAFARLAGAPMRFSKRTAAGRDERIAAVGPPPTTPRGAAPDDVLDALALAHSAAAMVAGDAWCLGDGAVDERGLRMEIWG
jgi:predicted RNase H-like nuclease